MKLILILSTIIFFSCNDSNSRESGKKNIDSLFKDKMIVDELKDLHIGECVVDSGFVIAQVFDKETRQQSKIGLVDLNKHKFLGFFNWPAKNNSFYFGNAYSQGNLIYFANKKFEIIDVLSKKSSSIAIKDKTSNFTNMIVINENAYSIGNIYGIDIISLKNTSKQLRFIPDQGSYYNEQNNISIPVDPNLNLVGSDSKDDTNYSLYAIDSKLKIKWEKAITVVDRFLKIQSLNIKDNFLVKYDNRLELISKTNGKTILEKSFEEKILDIFLLSEKKVIIITSDKTEKTDINNLDNSNCNLISLNSQNLEIEWSIKIPAYKSNLFMSTDNIMLLNEEKNFRISPSSSRRQNIDCPDVKIFRDRLINKNYVLHENTFYW